MAGKHQEPTWKDTKKEQRERKRWGEGLKDWCKGIEVDKVVVWPWEFHLIEIRWEAGWLEEQWRNWRKQATL